MSDLPDKLPPMPEPFDPKNQTLASYLGNVAELEHERALCAYWEARCRVAVTALHRISAVYDWNDAREALALIGPLPAKEEPK